MESSYSSLNNSCRNQLLSIHEFYIGSVHKKAIKTLNNVHYLFTKTKTDMFAQSTSSSCKKAAGL